MDFNVKDYIDEAECKQIARDAFREFCIDKFRSDAERIFSNAAYVSVRKMVDEAFDGQAEALVVENMKRVIKQLSTHTVFGSKGIYDTSDTEGRKALNAAVKKYNERIENRVAALIDTITKDDVIEALADADISFRLARS